MQPGRSARFAIALRGVSLRKMMTMRLPYRGRNRAWLRHGGIECRCCACWGWLVLGCSGGWGVHSCGWVRPRVPGVAARAAVPYVAAGRVLAPGGDRAEHHYRPHSYQWLVG